MEHPAPGTLRAVTGFASVQLAQNPGPMTLDGTNTWLFRAPGQRDCVVIDPGPSEPDHLRAVADQGPVSLVLLTHHHGDHTDGVDEFAALTGAPVRAWDADLCRGAQPFRDGEEIDAAGVRLRVVATPGHTRDSVSFLAEYGDEQVVFTGDSILGRGTTVVAHPDGHLGSYVDSLRTLAGLPAGTRALPGHGPELPDAAEVAAAYLEHRERRLNQVREVVRDHGPDVTARRVVEIVYADVDPAVWPAAEWSVQAQLTYLSERGEL